MASKKNLHVVRHSGGGWAVKREQGQRASSRHATQGQAIERARQQAQRSRSEVVIHGRDGRIRDRDSYGKDPMPPRDKKH